MGCKVCLFGMHRRNQGKAVLQISQKHIGNSPFCCLLHWYSSWMLFKGAPCKEHWNIPFRKCARCKWPWIEPPSAGTTNWHTIQLCEKVFLASDTTCSSKRSPESRKLPTMQGSLCGSTTLFRTSEGKSLESGGPYTIITITRFSFVWVELKPLSHPNPVSKHQTGPPQHHG